MRHRSGRRIQSVQGYKNWADLLLAFYHFWHGRLGLKGAGYLIGKNALLAKSLQSFPLRLPEGHSIIIDFRDVSSMSWVNHLLGEEFQEAALIRAITSTIQKDAVVWDVGANCGLFSYLTAQSPRVKQIVFCEPNEHMFRMCCDALKIYSKASGLNVALSDKCGEADLVVPLGASTMGSLQSQTLSSAASRLRVRCVTGDDLVTQGLPVPDVIKIDTEGHELAVLRGLTATIHKYQPAIFLENLSFDGSDFSRLLPSTYEIFSIDSPSGALVKGCNKSLSHNSAFIPRDRRQHI
jgi:FkbM family methyltransferase